MTKTIEELAKLVGGKIEGDKKIKISGVANLEKAAEGEISFLVEEKLKELSLKSQASALVISDKIETFPKPVIKVSNPRLAFAKIMEVFAPQVAPPLGVHPSAVLSEEVSLSKDVSIGPNVFIGRGAQIGERVTLQANVYIGEEVRIGSDTLIYPNVTIREGVIIGQKVIIHPGVVIGSDGFGFVKEGGKHYKIPQIGKVIIEDEVEIGANCCIDRGTLDATIIGRGTKLDNLVQVGHNVIIGENSIIVGQVGISGSVKIGDRVTLAGQAGISDHLTIGSDTIIGGGAGVTKDVPPNSFYSGYPAGPHREQKRIQAIIHQLPKLWEKVKKLERMVK